MSAVVELGGETQAFLEMLEVHRCWFSESCCLMENATLLKGQPKLSLSSMEGLLLGLSRKKVLAVVARHQKEFLELHLRDWLSRADQLLVKAMLPDVDRVSDVLSHFETAYTNAGLAMTDLRERHSKLMHALRKAASQPNNLQLGIAQVLAQLSTINRR